MSERKISIDHLHESPRLKPDAVDALIKVGDRLEEAMVEYQTQLARGSRNAEEATPTTIFLICRNIVGRNVIDLLREVEQSDRVVEQPEPDLDAMDPLKPCPHGNDPVDCDPCFQQSDEAYDAQREGPFKRY